MTKFIIFAGVAIVLIGFAVGGIGFFIPTPVKDFNKSTPKTIVK
ncbi:hypothetical protein Cha6605_2919 [Chamaesiphon minutus PCC 6605]|uniref:Uncharacterized protein n=1 Tax=Chamaesiphon minutus (strain ATCC 27169 / PCC 6605) TaxID=1173020 RepID=K9UFR6_CHAP6|nr:hypothetical protein Cha6605_2919 [Chamaesiphon minutus PCC 6605]